MSERLASDWTADDGAEKVTLPGDQWVQFRTDVSYGEQMRLDIACKSLADEEAFAKRLAFHISAWSLTYPDGRPLPVVEESIQALSMKKVRLLLEHLAQHNEEVKAQHDDPLSDGASTSASPSAA